MAGAAPEKKHHLLPFDTIVAAVSGDEEAICTVVRHYDRYITALAIRERTGSDGKRRKYVDDALKSRLITRLITGVLKFRLDRGD